MQTQYVNWWAVVAAALSTFILGGLWYSPALFGKAWMTENGFRAEERPPNMAKVFGLSLVFSLLMAANLAMFLAEPKTTAWWGATAGLLAGFGLVALAVAIIALFERRSWRYILINGGYMTTAFVLMGLILGAWR
jgi:hypothetical protein